MKFVLILLAIIAIAAPAQAAPERPAAPDYADPADWACRPGAEARCTENLDAIVLGADGSRTKLPFTPAADPPIDCFYVYPTASMELQDYADLTPGFAIMIAVRTQAGRLASVCRLYAPLYRQATLKHLLNHNGDRWDGPYDDVSAAWDWYLSHDNQGRGVVLIGHSQGTIMLQRLIAERIDGTPAQSRLVSAFLIGDPGLLVPQGETIGGTFKHIPICTDAAQTGCAWTWSSYLAGDDGRRVFGANKQGLAAACTNPASPAGGTGTLDAFFPGRDFAGSEGAAFVELPGQLTATCSSDAQGTAFRIAVAPGPNADAIQSYLDKSGVAGFAGDWGLHRRDVSLTQGTILSLIRGEAAGWRQDRH